MRLFFLSVWLAFAMTCVGHAATFNFGWAGSDNVTLSGSFSFDNALLPTATGETKYIVARDLTAFSFSAFMNGSKVADWPPSTGDIAPDPIFNFNFDVTGGAIPGEYSGHFRTGGNSMSSSDGQYWGGDWVVDLSLNTLVFQSGKSAQQLEFGEVTNPPTKKSTSPVSNLTAEFVIGSDLPAVPLPGGLPLLLSGIMAILFSRRRPAP